MILLQLTATAALFFGVVQSTCINNDQCGEGRHCGPPEPLLLLKRGRSEDDVCELGLGV